MPVDAWMCIKFSEQAVYDCDSRSVMSVVAFRPAPPVGGHSCLALSLHEMVSSGEKAFVLHWHCEHMVNWDVNFVPLIRLGNFYARLLHNITLQFSRKNQGSFGSKMEMRLRKPDET